MKIVKIGDLHRVLYVAKNFQAGLTDITGKAISPTGVVTNIVWNGTDPTLGFCELGQGIYYYDWDSTGKAAGTWTFKADSASKPAPGADSIQVVDGDTLNDTPYEKIDTMLDTLVAATDTLEASATAIEGKVDTVITQTDTLEASATAIEGKVDGIATDVTTIEGLATGVDGFSATKVVVDAIQTAIGGISNSTKNTWVTSDEVVIPDTGSITRRVYMSIFDGSGNMEDPDSNQIAVKIFTMAGVDVTTDYLAGVEPIYMTKDATGQYHIDYTVESTDTAQPLLFRQTYLEGGLTVVRDGVVNLVTGLSGDISARFDTVDAAIAAVDGKVDTVIAQTDTLEASATAIEGKVDTAISDIGTVSTNVGTPVSGTLASNIEAIAATLAPGGYII